MAVGRISGQLLTSTLERDGIDLTFTNNGNGMLHFDMQNDRLGVKKTNPSYEFDVDGTVHSTTIRSGEAVIDNVTINDNIISTTVGNLEFTPATTLDKVVVNGDIDANEYYISGNSVLNSTTLGSEVVNSSLTSVGTIETGTWQGSTIGTGYGGTGKTSLDEVNAADFGSNDGVNNAALGHLLTADGNGGVTWASPGAVIIDGDKGDIVVSNSNTTWTINNGVVGEDKITSALSSGGNATASYVLTADGSGNVDWVAQAGSNSLTQSEVIALGIALG